MSFRHFEKKNWLGLAIACILTSILWIHSLTSNFLLGRDGGFDLFFNASEFLVGLFLILLGIFQGDAVDRLDSIGDKIAKYL
jgi:hypothetical protein